MKNIPIKVDKKILLERTEIIQKSVKKLQGLQKLSMAEFLDGENFAIAEHYLRYALESTFDICAHILARIPGAQADEYKKMAVAMATHKILPKHYAVEILQKMAGYRNRLTHFYFEITPKEMRHIIQYQLSDFQIFLKYIKAKFFS